MAIYATTGGASGIGEALIARLKADGHQIINVDIKEADIIADLSGREGRQAAIDGILAQAPDGIDGFIPLAGLGGGSAPNNLITSVNYFGTIELVEGLRDVLKARAGNIVLLTSNSAPMQVEGDSFVADLLAGDEAAALANKEVIDGTQYMLTKRAIVHWMQRNIMSLGEDGIRINAVAPGPVLTPMTEPLFNSPEYAPIMQGLLDDTPIKRAAQPEEIVECILFLLSDKSRYVGGTVLFVDGGYDAHVRQDRI